MPSILLSRVFGQNSVFAQHSLYDTLRQQDEEDEDSDTAEDLEERAGLRAAHFDEELEAPDDYELRPPPDLAGSSYNPGGNTQFVSTMSASGMNYMSPRIHERDTEAEEVPASLLIERTSTGKAPEARFSQDVRESDLGINDGRPSGVRKTGVHPHWAQAHITQRRELPSQERIRKARLGLIDPKQRALWKWANVENLDNFLHDVYQYYQGNGIYSIILTRLLNLLTTGFVIGFTAFLTLCIDYTKVRNGKKMDDITVPHCTRQMSGTATMMLWVFSLYWIVTLFQYILDLRRLWELHNFYKYLLEIPDTDMQTIAWQEVIHRLMNLRDANPVTSNALRRRHLTSQSKQRMDAHDIANRLMRKENYLIALFNKDILDLTVPLPFLGNRRGVLTKTLEWNIDHCILDFVFNNRGQLRPVFLKESERRRLSDALRARFLFVGWMNLIFAPFIISYFILLYFFTYFNEFQKNPGQIGHRQYTPLAEWKFREFNELFHIFEQRINMSYPFAARYVDQFPKDKTVQVARFVSFVAGSFAAVLAIASVVDPENFLAFEITTDRTVLFYIGVFGSILAISRGMIPEEKLVYDPEEAIKYVINYTHYMPQEWEGKLHSDDVKRDFMSFYDLKVMIFLQELLSVIVTPFVLWFSLPKCSDRIVDFFREFTVHVDGIGYVCSFAMFDFKRNGSTKGAVDYSSKDNKMMASYWGFLDNYGPTTRTGNKRQHQMPLHAGGGMSPVLNQHDGVHGVGGGINRLNHRGSGPAMHQSMYKGTATGLATGNLQASMGGSILLDPHHQPPPGAFSRRPPMFHHPHTHTTASVVEEDEEQEPSSEMFGGSGGGSGGAKKYRSALGESFMSARVSTTISGDGDEEQTEPEGAGVLGLLYQFQKVQDTAGGRGGVNI